MNTDTTKKPWDGLLASVIVRPLIPTAITPNHLTTLRLAVGLAAALVVAHGGQSWLVAGTLLYILSNFIDHTDGALARSRGTHSEWGAVYDQWCDGLVQVLVFAGIGIGLRESWLGLAAPVVGVVFAVAVACIFIINARGEKTIGNEASDQPTFAGFEIEDVLYLVPLVAVFGWLPFFIVSGSIGAPIYLSWSVWRQRRLQIATSAAQSTDSSPDAGA